MLFVEHAYLCENETCADPDSAGSERQRSSQTLTAENTTCSDDLYGLTSHGALVAFAKCGDRWNENGRRHISSVATTLTSLCADHVRSEFEALLDVLWVSDHVHVENAGLVKTLNSGLGRNADS